MLCRRIERWLLILGLVACTERERGTESIATPSSGASTGAGARPGAAGGSGHEGGLGGSAGSGGAGIPDANTEGGVSDGAPDTPLVIIHQDGRSGPATCADNATALGSNRLLAGGATPPNFEAAYNAELAASNTPGPLLLAFFGVNDTSLLGWIAAVGALEPTDEGDAVRFAGTRAEVPFTLAPNRSLRIAPIAADFELELATPSSTFVLPIGSIALEGVLSVGCGSLTVDKATLLVPVRAGSTAFHGSTVEALMGPPTETLRGAARAAWPLELSGKAARVYAPGLRGDAGIEP